MIKRSYFMHGKKNRNDGSGSYYYMYTHFVVRSWIADDYEAFEHGKTHIVESLKDKPGNDIEITAFNRC